MDADGSAHRFLIDGSNARWSPSGDRILFLAADEHDKPQIFVRWMDAEGAVSQVTRVDVTPSVAASGRPTARRSHSSPSCRRRDDWSIDMPRRRRDASGPSRRAFLDRLHYRQDRVGFTDPGFSHLFVVPASSGTARQLTDGEWNVGAHFDGCSAARAQWMPDGETIVFDGWKKRCGTSSAVHIYAIDVETRGDRPADRR